MGIGHWARTYLVVEQREELATEGELHEQIEVLRVREARAVADDAVMVAGEERILLGDHLPVLVLLQGEGLENRFHRVQLARHSMARLTR